MGIPLLPIVLLAVGLTSTTITAQPVSPLWDPSENRDSYVHFPDEMKELLDAEFKTLMRSPQLSVFTTVPEPEWRVYPLVKGMMLRNHLDNKILWAHPNYLITDGLEYGCRELVEGTDHHVAVESALCEEHCLHQGRYCAPFEPNDMPSVLPFGFQGKELVKESLRRLCFDHYYHASDVKYFEYLELFDRKQCLQQPGVSQCSMQVIEEVDHANYDFLEECVNETAWNTDYTSERLELQLTEARRAGANLANMPLVKIGDIEHPRPQPGQDFTTQGIFAHYCTMFGERAMHPVSCDVCGGCQDVRKCLWTLECDGVPLDPVAFLKEHAGENGIPSEIIENDAADQTTTPPAASNNDQQEPTNTLPSPNYGPALSASDNSNNLAEEYEEEEEKEAKTGVIMLLVIMVVSGLIVAFITYRDRRTKILMAQIHAQQMANGYRDDQSIYVDYIEDSMRGGDALELSPSSRGISQPPKVAFLPEMT